MITVKIIKKCGENHLTCTNDNLVPSSGPSPHTVIILLVSDGVADVVMSSM